uniref:UDENN FNIP1/2-type domain-containing protein n=1 Tax=Ciona intestinalis TaxID=7719 RepID=F6Y978_CIOIN
QQQQEQKPQYQYVRTPADWDMLSEMLFGSVGMAHKVASIKIHYVKSPPQIMLSRVFCLPSLKDAATVRNLRRGQLGFETFLYENQILDRGMENHLEMQRSNAVSSRRKANTMPVPSPVRSHTPQPINRLPRSDSSSSLTNFFANPYLLHSSTGSLGTTKIQIPSIHNKSHSLPKHQRDSFTLHEEINEKSVPFRRGKLRIGFAVLCEPEPSNAKAFRQFFFEHFPIIETHMTKLKNDIEQAFKFQPKQEFYHSMMKALSTFTLSLQTLYSTPRLPEPVWSTLQCPTTSTHQRSVVVNCFMGDLVRLVAHCNSKQKNCFFTGLLTSVLTHHLGWVSSATPSNGGNEPQENYNALWVQLGDLYGAVGSPTKVCRTVVTGSNHESVSTVLSVLSYFIRSARVDDVVPVPEKITPASLGVPTTVPVKNIRTNLVESELEDDEYVLVSVDDDVTMSQGTSSNSMTSSCSMTSSSSMTSSKNTMASSNIMTSSNSVTSSSALTSLKNNMTSSSTTTSSGMMTSSNRNNIHRSTSSPNASYTGDSPLLRTYSNLKTLAPMLHIEVLPLSRHQLFVWRSKIRKQQFKSSVTLRQILDLIHFIVITSQYRQRTYSNDGLLRHRGIQSRRKSHDTTCDKVAVESMVRSSTSTLSLNAICVVYSCEHHSRAENLGRQGGLQPINFLHSVNQLCQVATPLSLEFSAASNHRIILNKPDDVAAFELKLPEIPTHQPGCEPTIRNKPIPAKKLPTKDDAPSGDTNPQPREFPIPRPRDLPLPSLTPTNTYTPCSFKHSNDITFRELPLSDVIDDEDKPNKPRTDSVGFDSLMADYNPEYLTDFVLHGSHDHPDMHERILQDLDHMTRIPSLDEPVAEAVCILADTENWTVKVYSSQRLHSERPSLPALTSKLVGSILQRTAHLYNHKMSAQFCLENLERELRQLVLKSRMLAEYVRGIKRVTVDQLSAVLNIESQDIPLLMAIASCHSPHVAPVML